MIEIVPPAQRRRLRTAAGALVGAACAVVVGLAGSALGDVNVSGSAFVDYWHVTSLRAQLHSLGATWRDQEHKKFVEDFEEHMKVIGRYVEVTNEHAPFLLRKADRIEEYLQQR